MSKLKNGELDQYGAGPFEQQQFGTSGVERVKLRKSQAVAHNSTRFALCSLQSEHLYCVNRANADVT